MKAKMMSLGMDEEEQQEHEVDCDVETLIEAEEIKKDGARMAKVLERTKEKQEVLKSIAGLRKRASAVLDAKAEESKKPKSLKDDLDPELMTEEDKAAIQEDDRVNKNLKEMGLYKEPKKKK